MPANAAYTHSEAGIDSTCDRHDWNSLFLLPDLDFQSAHNDMLL